MKHPEFEFPLNDYDDGLAPARGCAWTLAFGCLVIIVVSAPWWLPALVARMVVK